MMLTATDKKTQKKLKTIAWMLTNVMLSVIVFNIRSLCISVYKLQFYSFSTMFVYVVIPLFQKI